MYLGNACFSGNSLTGPYRYDGDAGYGNTANAGSQPLQKTSFNLSKAVSTYVADGKIYPSSLVFNYIIKI